MQLPIIIHRLYILLIGCVLSHVGLFATLWPVVPQALCAWDSPGRYWSGFHFSRGSS